MEKIKTKKLNIGQIGTLKINIPIVSSGAGKKRIVILCGIHGDEKSGLFVVNRLLKDLKDVEGKIDIILAANPLAQSLGMRVSPNDFHNLNRIFPGNKNTDFSRRLANKIFNFCKGANAVIDLHTFQDNAPIVAIFVNSGNEIIKKKCLELINVFNPQAIWKVNFESSEESKFSGALGSVLAVHGIVNFAVEMPEVFSINDEQLDQVKNGLLRVLGFLGFVKISRNNSRRALAAPIFQRIKVRTNEAGLFIPIKSILKKIKKGEIVGRLVSLPDFKVKKVTSPCHGTLLIIKSRDLVATGDVLFSIGQSEQ